MTDTNTPYDQPLPPPMPPPRRLVRTAANRRWLGVADSLARYLGVPVKVIRIVFVVTSFFGGLGLFAYLAGAVLIPTVGDIDPLGDRIAKGRPEVLLALIGAIALGTYGLFNGRSWDLVVVAVLGGLGVYLWTDSNRRPAMPLPFGSIQDAPADGRTPPAWAWPVAPTSTVPTSTPPVARRRTVAWIGLAAAFVTMVALAPSSSIFGVVLAGLLVLLAAFLVGIVVRRGSWLLLLPILALAVLLFPAKWYSSAGVPLDAPSGEQTLDLNSAKTEGKMSAGHYRVLLRQWQPGRPINLTIGAGAIDVEVPADVLVTVHTRVGAGAVNIPGTTYSGASTDVTQKVGPPAAARRIDLDLRVGMGAVTIKQVAAEGGSK